MKLLALILLSLNLYSHKGNDTIRKPELKNTGGLCDNVIGVCKKPFYTSSDYVFDSQIYQHRCDTLAQVKFWRKIMNLSKDTVLISIGQSRDIIEKTCHKNWYYLSAEERQKFRDSVRVARGLDSTHKVLVTYGRQFFYDFDKAYEKFDKGINDFVQRIPIYAEPG